MGRLISRIRAWAAKHPARLAALVAVALGLFVFAIVWFEPHKLFLDQRVNESPPGASDTPDPSSSPASPEGPANLSTGEFRPLEHDVQGRALVLETADGTRFLRFEDLDVSNGPDLVVYLSALGADQGWHDADDAEFLDLGALKGNVGDQNYELPAGVDLGKYRSVVIWCRRFTVGFAVAPVSVTG